MILDQLITDLEPKGFDLKKWQDLVNLLAEIFDAASGDIIQYHDGEFVVVSSSQNESNFLKVGSSWSWNSKTFCRYIVEHDTSLYEENATSSEYWKDAPFVANGTVCSYLGEPIHWPDGKIFGTFCVIDNKPNQYSEKHKKILFQLKLIIESELQRIQDFAELHKTMLALKHSQKLVEVETAKRQETETKLYTQESIVQATLDVIVDAVIRIDEHGTIVFVNTTTTSMFGYEESELLNQNIRILMPSHHAHRHNGYISDYALTGVKKMIGLARKTEAMHKNGSLFPIRLSVSELFIDHRIQYLGVIEDISEKVEAEKKLVKHALYDNLTNCANRNLLVQRFEYHIADCKRNNTLFTIAYIDLDKFKPVNDTYGHKCGDHVLVQISQRIRGSLREVDLVARVGGDEFVILFANSFTEDKIKTKLLNAIRQKISFGQYELQVDASIGFATYPLDGHNMDRLLESADKRMYKDKLYK